MSTTTDIARRPNGTAAIASTSSAVAIRSGQVEFDDKQKAALVAMGVSAKVTRAELAVFFHQCRTLRLDPFQKQIYLIHRRSKENGEWVEKPTTQIGIDGFRVTRDRIERERGLAVSYEETVWYDADRNPYDVWVWDEPPAACKFTVLVDDGTRVRRFPSVLRFNEYCQFGKEDASGVRQRTGRWRDGHAHQIEKCAEADALRRAFPNDLSGVILTDAAPLDDPDAPEPRQRVTGEQARARAQQHQQPAPADEPVDAEIVDDGPGWPEGATAERPTTSGASSSADAPASPSPAKTGKPSPSTPSGSAAKDPRDVVLAELDRLGITSHDARAEWLTQLTRKPVASVEDLTRPQAAWFAERLAKVADRAGLEQLVQDGTAPQ